MLKSCRVCKRPGPSICNSCKAARERARPSRQDRGYDAHYERARAAMVEAAWRGGVPCVICGSGFSDKSEITAEHVVPLRAHRALGQGGRVSPDANEQANLAPAHARCNSAWRRNRT